MAEVWALDGEPCGKYLALVIEDTLERLLRFGELGKVPDRITDEVLAEVKAMSPATIDRYLAPVKTARYPEAKSATQPGLILQASIPLRTAMDRSTKAGRRRVSPRWPLTKRFWLAVGFAVRR